MADLGNSTAETEHGSGEDAERFEWAIVEIFGHRRLAGRSREEERFGSKMLRIDVPVEGDPAKGWTSHFYGGSAIFSFTPSDEATIMRINRPYDSPSPYRLPQPDYPDTDEPEDPDAAELRW